MASSLKYITTLGSTSYFSSTEATTAIEALVGIGIGRQTARRIIASGKLILSNIADETQHVAVSPNEPVLPQQTMAIQTDYEYDPDSDPDPAKEKVAPSPVHVLYEDPFIVAVEKPAGVLVHSDGGSSRTLTDDVCRYLGGGDASRSVQAIHRLDTETTGVVLFSKTWEWQSAFDAVIANRLMHKRYAAVVSGNPKRDMFAVDAPIARDRHDAHKMRVASKGQEAHTRVTVLAKDATKRHALVSVEIGTGRKHQIRVHLASVGCPVVNDPLYGRVENEAGLLLHAFEVSFVHPVTMQSVRITCPVPRRFDGWFDKPVAQLLV